MAKDQKRSLRREFSAGGVVFKRVLRVPRESQVSRVEWLVGKHSGYHKWVLPKGVIEAGEKGFETAIREAEEEMGVTARPVAKEPLHKISYFFWQDGTRVFKRVNFYLMEYESGDIKNHSWEMEEVRWLPYEKALKLLAFEGEREALGIAHEMVK